VIVGLDGVPGDAVLQIEGVPSTTSSTAPT
jgi:hypothetical protein